MVLYSWKRSNHVRWESPKPSSCRSLAVRNPAKLAEEWNWRTKLQNDCLKANLPRIVVYEVELFFHGRAESHLCSRDTASDPEKMISEAVLQRKRTQQQPQHLSVLPNVWPSLYLELRKIWIKTCVTTKAATHLLSSWGTLDTILIGKQSFSS